MNRLENATRQSDLRIGEITKLLGNRRSSNNVGSSPEGSARLFSQLTTYHFGHNQNFLNQLIRLIQQLIERLQHHQHVPRPRPHEYRTIDGSNNNPFRPNQGKAGELLHRIIPQDRTREPGGATEAGLPSAREVSNAVSAQSDDTENKKGLSDMFWLWGQFIDHDIDLTGTNPDDPADISVPKGDPFFDPTGTGTQTIGFDRSVATLNRHGGREQANDITAFIDGSNVYGSDQATASGLRTYEGGKLKTSDGNLLPMDDEGMFMAGDVRANEHGGLTSMHTLWMREHNRIADNIAEKRPHWGDEKIYQTARKQVIAQMQAITYNEFLPLMLGDDAPGEYQGYNPKTIPQISQSFSAAAYRMGHSMLSPELLRLEEDGSPIPEGNLALRDAFFQPERVSEAGIEPFLRGLSAQTAQALDPLIIDDVRNFLFGPPGAGGFDLAALNIQRGRDHALPGYNDAREALGLERIDSFDDPIFDSDFGQKLASVYKSPDDVDLWVAGLAEKDKGNSMMGETLTTIIKDQFERTREGDRFWYENSYSGRSLDYLNNLRLSDIIERNTDIENIQDDVMIASNNIAPAIGAVGADGRDGSDADPQPTSPQPRIAGDFMVVDDFSVDLETQMERILDALQRGHFG